MTTLVLYDMVRHTGTPLVGNPSTTWGIQGNCFSAQSIIFPYPYVKSLVVQFARWRVCWDPNTPGPSVTGVKLMNACDGPSYIQDTPGAIIYTSGSAPRNDAFDITAFLQALIAQTGQEIQFFTYSMGTGTQAPTIYSSALEVVYG